MFEEERNHEVSLSQFLKSKSEFDVYHSFRPIELQSIIKEVVIIETEELYITIYALDSLYNNKLIIISDYDSSLFLNMSHHFDSRYVYDPIKYMSNIYSKSLELLRKQNQQTLD